MTNHEFAKKDPLFLEACSLANVQPSRRQASKFRLGKGTAYPFRLTAAAILKSKEAEVTDETAN
jgi:hypothetical protein